MSILTQSTADNRRSSILREVASALQTAESGITDIESVVAMTRVAPQAISDEFGGMNGIVIALVERLSASMVEPLGPCTTDASFREQLRAFAARVIDANTSSQLKTLYRIALTDAIRNTGLGRDFYEHGPGRLTAELAKFIGDAQQHGIVCGEDCRSLASHFMAILRARLDLSDTFSSDLPHAFANPEADVALAVGLFCDGTQQGA